MGPGGALPPPWRPLPPTAPAVCPPASADAVAGPPGPPYCRGPRTRARLRSVPRVLFCCCSAVVQGGILFQNCTTVGLLLFRGPILFHDCTTVVLLLFKGVYCSRIVVLLFYCCSGGLYCSSVVLLLFKGPVLFQYYFRAVLLFFVVLFSCCFSHRVHPCSIVAQDCSEVAPQLPSLLFLPALFQYCSSVVFSLRSVSSSPLERYY